jgi:hypothetical protein
MEPATSLSFVQRSGRQNFLHGGATKGRDVPKWKRYLINAETKNLTGFQKKI